MPVSDSGPMLWPTSTVVIDDSGWSTETPRYGFLDVRGKVVIPPRYEGYELCRDRAGRASFVIATGAGRRADVLGLSGAVIARTPTPGARCGPPGTVLFREWSDPGWGSDNDGILDVARNRIVLPRQWWRGVDAVNDHTVNVSEKHGEYFLDLITGRRTRHPGWITDANLESGAPGLPASQWDEYEQDRGRFGFVNLSGKWIVEPTFQDASAFRSGHAVVELAEDRFTFLDTGLQRVGGEWSSIDPVYVDSRGSGPVGGYLVSADTSQALLGADLRVIVAPGPARITCRGEGGACAVVAADGTASTVLLPEGTLTPMPAGFTQAISRTVVADRLSPDDTAARRILDLGSGVAADLTEASTCDGVGTAWVACEPRSGIPSLVLIDPQGRRTPVQAIETVADPVSSGSSAYYWVVAGKYQGYIDAKGEWRYRESRYLRIEE